MKVERLAPHRTQRTVLAHGKATVSVEAGNLILEEGYATFAVESDIASRRGRRGHYRLAATLTEGELEAALEAIRERRGRQLDDAEPASNPALGITALFGDNARGAK